MKRTRAPRSKLVLHHETLRLLDTLLVRGGWQDTASSPARACTNGTLTTMQKDTCPTGEDTACTLC
jgi:hypothetical protein